MLGSHCRAMRYERNDRPSSCIYTHGGNSATSYEWLVGSHDTGDLA